jgi:L-asparaginase/Glu-tRNA(Gln) amidotransferase subunit D
MDVLQILILDQNTKFFFNLCRCYTRLVKIEDNTSSASGQSIYITATGGTITTSGDYKIHTFTSDGTFCVSAGLGPLAKCRLFSSCWRWISVKNFWRC